MNGVRRFLWFVSLLVLIVGVAVALAQVSEWSGLRDKWAAKRAQAEAARLEAVAHREAQMPLITAAMVDTLTAAVSAVIDKVLLLGLVVYLIRNEQERRRGEDVRE